MRSSRHLTPIRAIVLGALVVGSFDGAYAVIFWGFRGAAPARIFQSVAAGLLGRSAFEGGYESTALGVILHYFISLAIVTVYWLASRWLPVLLRRPAVCGAIYGLIVYFFMNYVVIPLSAAARPRFLASWVICSLLVHAFLIGIPAAMFARAAALGKPRPADDGIALSS